MNPLDLIREGVAGLVTSVGGVLDKLSTTQEEKLEAQRKLLELERNFLIRLTELDAEWAKTGAEVIKAEVASQSWMARNWRPITMLVFTYIVFHTHVLVPVFGLVPVLVPADLWDLMKIGMGGYLVGRTVEKTAPAVVEAIRKK